LWGFADFSQPKVRPKILH